MANYYDFENRIYAIKELLHLYNISIKFVCKIMQQIDLSSVSNCILNLMFYNFFKKKRYDEVLKNWNLKKTQPT